MSHPTAEKSGILRFALFIILLPCLESAWSQDLVSGEEAWRALSRHLQANSGLVAEEIHTRFRVPYDGGPVHGSFKTTVCGRVDGEIERNLVPGKVSSADEQGYKLRFLGLSIARRLANHPEQLFASVQSSKTLPDERLNGKLFTVLEVNANVQKGLPVRAKVWIDPAGGSPFKLSAVIEKSPLPGVKSIAYSVDYDVDKNGRSLPNTVNISYVLSFLFKTGDVNFTQEIRKWKNEDSFLALGSQYSCGT
jgi:hypothetical protein